MKKNMTLLFAALMGIIITAGCDNSDPSSPGETETFDPIPVTKTNSVKIYAHYMTWFETNASSPNGQWGYHWTMANKNPNNMDGNGRREIASHYYPLIGPYHSGDRDVIENHLLLMKYSGIDGVLIDWYGTYNLNDYGIIKENTEQLIAMLDDVGLEYAIVYEDRFLNDIVTAGLAPTAVNAAKTDFAYLKNNYFNDDNYININGKPLLMNFGPITLTTADNWTAAFANLDPKPTFLTLWGESGEAGANASGEYAWVYQDNTYLENFYNNTLPGLNVAMGGAYPGFDDFYEEGGTSTDIGWTIAHNNGITLDQTLALAANADIDYLQLITWNDFGEGTMIEPTVEFGYNYLQKIKTFAGVQDAGSLFSEIGKLYDFRKQYAGNASIQKKLDRAFDYFVSLQTEKAIEKLNEIQ